MLNNPFLVGFLVVVLSAVLQYAYVRVTSGKEHAAEEAKRAFGRALFAGAVAAGAVGYYVTSKGKEALLTTPFEMSAPVRPVAGTQVQQG